MGIEFKDAGSGVDIARKVKSGSIHAVVTRADGTVEDLGMVSYHSSNPIKHLAVNAWIKARDWWRVWRNAHR